MSGLPDEKAETQTTRLEAGAALVAGIAFAASALFLRTATPLPPALFDATAMLLVGLGVSPLAARLFGAPGGSIARGAGLAAASVALAPALVTPWDRTVIPLALIAGGAALLQAGHRARRHGIVLGALGAATATAAVWSAWELSATLPETERLRGALAMATGITLAGAALAFLLRRRGHQALAPTPAGIILAAAIAAVYVNYRGLAAQRLANLPLYEWTLGVGIALLLVGRLRRAANEKSAAEAWRSDARRHAQTAAPVYDARMSALAAPVQRYLDRGDGFDEYKRALAAAVPRSAGAFHRALAAATPPAGRAHGKQARAQRLALHEGLLSHLPAKNEASHGPTQPGLSTHH